VLLGHGPTDVGTVTSTLYRLLRYAKGGPQETRENFTTEALRAAIREDPTPLVRVLRTAGVLPAGADVPEVETETQVRIAVGQLDLVVAARTPAWRQEVWVEVKTGAAEHGGQLKRYVDAAAGRPVPRPIVVLLGPWPLTVPDEVRQIRWSELVRAARDAARSNRSWSDLIQFLRETHMADDYDGPVTARQAGSLLDAHALLRKMRRLLRRTARALTESGADGQPAILPVGFTVPGGQVANTLVSRQFADHARFALPIELGHRAELYFGVLQVDLPMGFDEADPQAMVWLQNDPRDTDLRAALLDRADVAGLDPNWQRSTQGWWALYRRERLAAFAELPDLRQWWVDRVLELSSADLLTLPRSFGPSLQVDEAAEEV
jgi:hypothetical protein